MTVRSLTLGDKGRADYSSLSLNLDVAKVPTEKRGEFLPCQLMDVEGIRRCASGRVYVSLGRADKQLSPRSKNAADLGQETLVLVKMLNRFERDDEVYARILYR